jgi:hypothetical protein
MIIGLLRSAIVSGNLPIPANAFGQKTRNFRKRVIWSHAARHGCSSLKARVKQGANRLFAIIAVLGSENGTLGADRATWTRSQFVRIPDGIRENGNQQTLYFFNPAVRYPKRDCGRLRLVGEHGVPRQEALHFLQDLRQLYGKSVESASKPAWGRFKSRGTNPWRERAIPCHHKKPKAHGADCAKAKGKAM